VYLDLLEVREVR